MASSENPPTDLILDFFPEPKNIHHVDPEPHIHLHSMGETCRRPDCSWIRLSNITSLASHAPHLHAEPELSGIGVSLRQTPIHVPVVIIDSKRLFLASC